MIGRIRVLLIEDNPQDAELILRELASLKCAVIHFPEADPALVYIVDNAAFWKRAEVPPPAIALIDLKLTGGMPQGIEVFRGLKMHAPQIPAVILTGYPDSEAIRQALPIGYFGLAEKPATAAMLKEIFEAHRLL